MSDPAHIDDPDVRIRTAVFADAAQVAELSGQLGYSSSAEEVTDRLERIAADSRTAVLVAELPDGTLAGWVCPSTCLEPTGDPRGEILGLVVRQGLRNLRVGARLLCAAEGWIASQGCKSLLVHSNVIRLDAHRFYEREGYRLLKSQKVFHKDL